MLKGLIYLMLSQMLGYLTIELLSLPVPSPVMGLVILFVYLLVAQHIPDSLVRVSTFLLPLLPLFLLPASVGIVEHTNLLRQNAVAITTALVVSLLVSVVVTPYILNFFIRVFQKSQ